MPSSKKSMSKTRQLSALVNFVSCLRSNRTKARTRAFMRWRLNLEASRAAAAEQRQLRKIAGPPPIRQQRLPHRELGRMIDEALLHTPRLATRRRIGAPAGLEWARAVRRRGRTPRGAASQPAGAAADRRGPGLGGRSLVHGLGFDSCWPE